MKKVLVLSVFAATSLLLVQCSPKTSKSVASNPSTSHPQPSVEEIKKTYSEDQLAEGKAIFSANCAKCHKLFAPETRTVGQWERILPSMSKKAKLDENQASLVRAWVLTGAKAG